VTGPDLLHDRVGHLRSRMGALLPTQRIVFRDKDLHADLHDSGWMDIYLFGITGRRFTAAQLTLFEAMWVMTSYPDARIWNNRVAALAGASRSTSSLALAAGLAVSEAHIYGRGNEMQAVDFFIRTHRALAAGATLADCIAQEIATHGRVAGYGRPVINGDERLAPFMATARSLGLADGPHVRLASEVEAELARGGRTLSLNYGGLISAFGADLGLTPQEFCLFTFPVFLAGMAPCFIEANQRTEGSLFPIPATHVRYTGAPARTWEGTVNP
jgi:hypothetical protein